MIQQQINYLSLAYFIASRAGGESVLEKPRAPGHFETVVTSIIQHFKAPNGLMLASRP